MHLADERFRMREYRQRERDEEVVDDFSNEIIDNTASDSDTVEECIRHETHDELFSIMNDILSETERTILVDFFFEEKDTKEIAAELGITESCCRKKKERALKKLRAKIDKSDF